MMSSRSGVDREGKWTRPSSSPVRDYKFSSCWHWPVLVSWCPQGRAWTERENELDPVPPLWWGYCQWSRWDRTVTGQVQPSTSKGSAWSGWPESRGAWWVTPRRHWAFELILSSLFQLNRPTVAKYPKVRTPCWQIHNDPIALRQDIVQFSPTSTLYTC